MEKFIRKLKRLLRQRFPKCDPIIEPAGDRAGGMLVWSGFERMEQIKRQRILWAMLREKLPANEIPTVGVILTMSPNEVAVARS